MNLMSIRYACSIELKEMVILTGGQYTMSKVTVYNNEGFVDDWPELNTGRNNHGCGHYVNTASKMVRHIDKGRRQKKILKIIDPMKTQKSHIYTFALNSNISIIHSSNHTLQSNTLPVIHSLNPTLFQS